jgi:hypothetical protein
LGFSGTGIRFYLHGSYLFAFLIFPVPALVGEAVVSLIKR